MDLLSISFLICLFLVAHEDLRHVLEENPFPIEKNDTQVQPFQFPACFVKGKVVYCNTLNCRTEYLLNFCNFWGGIYSKGEVVFKERGVKFYLFTVKWIEDVAFVAPISYL